MPSGLAFDPPPHPPPPPPLSSSNNNSSSSNRQQAEAEARLAREAEEANRLMEIARKAEREEQEKEQQRAAQQRWEAQKLAQVKQQVLQKIIKHLEETSRQTKLQAQDYKKDQQRLTIAEEKLNHQLALYEQSKDALSQNVGIVEEKTNDIQAWLKEAEARGGVNGSSSSTGQKQDVLVDDLVQPVSPVHQQMLDLSAENASLTDALYFLDRSLYMGNLSCDTHLKHVRRLAKRQFLARAHLMKINQQLLKHNPSAAVPGAASF